MKPQAMNPAIACPRPHHAAKKVSTHCLLPGRYSRNTVVSRIKLPPPPKPTMAMKNDSEGQFGIAPAMIAEVEQRKSEMLNAHFLPTMSALTPQNRAPTSMPT